MNYIIPSHNTLPIITINSIPSTNSYNSFEFYKQLLLNKLGNITTTDIYKKYINLYNYTPLQYVLTDGEIHGESSVVEIDVPGGGTPIVYFELFEILSMSQIKCSRVLHATREHVFTKKSISFLFPDAIHVCTPYSGICEFDCIFVDFCSHDPARSRTQTILHGLCIILNQIQKHGAAILKVDGTPDAFMTDVIYILCYFFAKVTIMKPVIGDPISDVYYITCIGFYKDSTIVLDDLYSKCFNHTHPVKINSLLKDGVVPCHISNKITESALIIGQHQLESIEQLINILKNRNKEERICHLKKINTVKCYNWMVKHNFISRMIK